MPDYLHGDAISFEEMNSGKVDLMAWLGKHNKDVTRPAIDKVVSHLKAQGVQKFSAIGYCFGSSGYSLPPRGIAGPGRGRSLRDKAFQL